MIKAFFIQLSKPYYFSLFASVVLLSGLIFSPFLLSLGIWGLAIAAFAHQLLNITFRMPQQLPSRRKILSLTFLATFRNLHQKPVYLWLSLLLVVTAISGLWSSNYLEWLERFRIRIPFFILPWAFANLPQWQEKHAKNLMYFLVWAMTIACVGVGINYLLHFDAINLTLEKGKAIPVPRNHIRFNLILAFTIFMSGLLYLEQHIIKYAWERFFLATATLFLGVFLHILAVRSGIFAFYAGVLMLFYFMLFRWRRWKTALSMVGIIAILAVIAVKYIPSVQKKISYMSWSLERIKDGTGDAYSDGQRFVSIRVGTQIFLQNPLLGVGTGDVPSATNAKTFQLYPNFTEEPKMPHNQFIYILAATGLFGLLLSLVGMYYPLMLVPYRYNVMLWIFHALMFTSFMVEHTLETTIGANLFAYFHLFLLKIASERD